jgi:hypothetical protein
MVDSAVEVSLGGVRVYRATGGPSSVGMIVMPPGSTLLPDSVNSCSLYLVVITDKITLEVSHCSGGGGNGAERHDAKHHHQQEVFGTSQGAIVILSHGDTFSLMNT